LPYTERVCKDCGAVGHYNAGWAGCVENRFRKAREAREAAKPKQDQPPASAKPKPKA